MDSLEKTELIPVELTEETILRLLTRGQICAADVCCRDCGVKSCLRRLVLESCRLSLAADRATRPLTQREGPPGFGFASSRC